MPVLFNHTAQAVKIYSTSTHFLYSQYSTVQYSTVQYLGLGTPDFATALYMACPVVDGSPYWRTSGYYPRPLGSRTHRSGQRQVGYPSVSNETPPIPGLWYLQTGVFSSPSRLRRPTRFACQRWRTPPASNLPVVLRSSE